MKSTITSIINNKLHYPFIARLYEVSKSQLDVKTNSKLENIISSPICRNIYHRLNLSIRRDL